MRATLIPPPPPQGILRTGLRLEFRDADDIFRPQPWPPCGDLLDRLRPAPRRIWPASAQGYGRGGGGWPHQQYGGGASSSTYRPTALYPPPQMQYRHPTGPPVMMPTQAPFQQGLSFGARPQTPPYYPPDAAGTFYPVQADGAAAPPRRPERSRTGGWLVSWETGPCTMNSTRHSECVLYNCTYLYARYRSERDDPAM